VHNRVFGDVVANADPPGRRVPAVGLIDEFLGAGTDIDPVYWHQLLDLLH
jgi:hypothetical protein